MSNHTPGPWTVQPFGVVKLIQTLGYTTIAKVSADSVADARLIAAAPELLAALRSLVDSIELDVTSSGVLNRARDAIAKATGETNV